jgi:hypothetical protein
MSRVTLSTLRTAALSALAASAFGLSACGDDEPTPTSSTTPAATSAAATSPSATGTSSGGDAATEAATSPNRKPAPIPAVIDSPINVSGEGKKAIDAASEKPISQAKVDAKVDAVMKALDDAGFEKVRKSSGSENGPIVIQGGTATTVLVYPNEKLAARQASGFTLVLKTSKMQARLARKGNVIVAVNGRKNLTPELRKEFESARKIAFAN